ncbi:unnamed protein product [Meganyctiphanes norvegica]|uniref:PWWP domain-containing protein n=1 Tax=Meganyctiphanes norvegica TaxID=48144 RepID=A0AAV2QWU4_MEGNR
MLSNEKNSNVLFCNHLSTITNNLKIEKIPMLKLNDISRDLQNLESDGIKEKYSITYNNNIHNLKKIDVTDMTSMKENNHTSNLVLECQVFGNENEKCYEMKHNNKEDNEKDLTRNKSYNDQKQDQLSRKSISSNEDTLSNVEDVENTSGFEKSKVNCEGFLSSSSSDDDDDDDADNNDAVENVRDEDPDAKRSSSEFLGFASNIPITLSSKDKRKLKRNSNILYCNEENSECDLHLSSPFERPQKRRKIPEKPSDEKELYDLILEWKRDKLNRARENFNDQLLEKFFLENKGHMMDYDNWLRKPSWELKYYMEKNKLPGDDTLLKKFDGCEFYYYNRIVKEDSRIYDLVNENLPKKDNSISTSTNLTEKNILKDSSKQKKILSLIGRLAAPYNRSNIAHPKENSVTKSTSQESDEQLSSDLDCEVISISQKSCLDHKTSSNIPSLNKENELHRNKGISDKYVQNNDYGRLVWAKLKGYRPFPAMIVNPSECGMKPENDQVCVFWMGDTRVSQVRCCHCHIKAID